MILAIDPGPTHSALVWYKCGKVVRAKYLENADALDALCWINSDIRVVIEMIASYGMAVGAEVFETCVWIGRFMETAGPTHCHRVFRRDVKLRLCGSMRAKDSNIRQALIDKLGPVGTKKAPGPCYGLSGDLWSALAVAVTFAETAGSSSHASSVASVSSGVS